MNTAKNEDDTILSPHKNKDMPRISLVLPFELKMKNKQALYNLLKKHADIAEQELCTNFPQDKVEPVISKLRKVIKTIECPSNGKNIAIFISPSAEKVYYFTPSNLDKYKLPVLSKKNQS